MHRHLALAAGVAVAAVPLSLAALSACAGDAAGPTVDPNAGRLTVAVAALDLPDVTNARWTISVTNADGEPVWSETVDSIDFGDGHGSVTYVGTCDGQSSPNTVALELVSLTAGGATLVAGTDYVDPTALGPLTQSVDCTRNADQSVDFDVTILRSANQGFFDIGVTFADVFCSAKLDCGATTDAADDNNLLFNDGERDMTAVIGFACTGGAGADTHLFLDDVVIDCDGSRTVVDVSGKGNVDLTAEPSSNPDGYLFGAAVYRGREELYDKAYWNVSLGLDEASFGATCTLHLEATAADGPLEGDDGLATDPTVTYPVLVWDVVLSDESGRVCTTHPLNGSPGGVGTRYTELGETKVFGHGYARASDTVTTPTVDLVFDHRSTVATGDEFATALRGNGTIATWGSNTIGQQSPPGGPFVAVTAGSSHGCGLRGDGTMACWGSSFNGERTPPSPNAGFEEIAGSNLGGCALRTTGAVACWGQDLFAFGTFSPPSGVFEHLACGNHTCCAIDAAGALSCWGNDFDHQAEPPTPNAGFVDVAPGQDHTCALKASGKVVCWGRHTQLPADNSGFVAIDAGTDRTCGVRGNGTLACWGPSGTSAAGGSDFAEVSADVGFACAKRTNGSVTCWGQNNAGQLGAPPLP